MATKQGVAARTSAAKKSASGSQSRSGASSKSSQRLSVAGSALRSVVAGAAGAASTEALLDLVEKLGLVDLVVGRVRSRIEDTDIDEVVDEVSDYLRRNPEVLVVTLGAVTVATGLLVWLNNRRAWDGDERRGTGKRTPARSAARKSRPRIVEEEEDEE